jgi:hypothetical protein
VRVAAHKSELAMPTNDGDVELRLMPSGNGWYWEVLTDGRKVVKRGVADTEPVACHDAHEAAQAANLVQ